VDVQEVRKLDAYLKRLFGNQVGQPLDAANSNISTWFARVGQRPSVKA